MRTLSYEDSYSILEEFFKSSILWHRLGGCNEYEAISKATKEVEEIKVNPFNNRSVSYFDSKARQDFLKQIS